MSNYVEIQVKVFKNGREFYMNVKSRVFMTIIFQSFDGILFFYPGVNLTKLIFSSFSD